MNLKITILFLTFAILPIVIQATTFKTAKFVKRNVTAFTYLKSKIKADSLVGCGSWCLNTEKCIGFKLLGKNCTLCSDFNPHIKGYGVEPADEIRVLDGHVKFDWINFKPIDSSKNLILYHLPILFLTLLIFFSKSITNWWTTYRFC